MHRTHTQVPTPTPIAPHPTTPALKATDFWILAVQRACSLRWCGSPTFFRISVRFLFFTFERILFAIFLASGSGDYRNQTWWAGSLPSVMKGGALLAAEDMAVWGVAVRVKHGTIPYVPRREYYMGLGQGVGGERLSRFR